MLQSLHFSTYRLHLKHEKKEILCCQESQQKIQEIGDPNSKIQLNYINFKLLKNIFNHQKRENFQLLISASDTLFEDEEGGLTHNESVFLLPVDALLHVGLRGRVDQVERLQVISYKVIIFRFYQLTL